MKDNDLMPNVEESKVDQVQLIVKTLLKLQSKILYRNCKNQEEIKSVIRSMETEIIEAHSSLLK